MDNEIVLEGIYVNKSKRPPLEAKARKERGEMNNKLVLEGIRPNKKEKAITKSQCKSGEMKNKLVV
jgi:hypothetical protein